MVAELITTYGRYTLTKMQDIAQRLGFEIMYGDTDSLFLNNPPSKESLCKFQTLCKRQLDVELEKKNTYKTLILSAGKKHYIGLENGVIDVVGFEGKKSDRCEFIKETFDDLITNILKKNVDPIPSLTKAISNLEAGNAQVSVI